MKSLPEVEFSLLSIIDGPERPVRFDMPSNVVDFRSTPLWGVRGQGDLVAASGSSALRRRRRAATDDAVRADLVPLLSNFVDLLMVDEAEPDPDGFADIVHGLYRFFLAHDFDVAMRSAPAWDAVTATVNRRFASLAASHGYCDAPIGVADLTEGMALVRAWLAPLAQRLPDVDVAHAAMAGMCTLVAVAAMRDQGAGFMLTEHGIFLRERLLAEAPGEGSLFLKLFRLRFALRTTELSYALADRVAPCCDNHQRWELRIGAHPERVATIYYGVDASIFRPVAKDVEGPPTVVWVGRIDPLKDVETLLRAAAVVHRSRPDIIFRAYGAALPGSEEYRDRCMALRAELGLEDVVLMEGYTSSPSAAFNQGDLVALSSISEGFPYSTLEAMLCSKAVVATAVGGIAEQVRGCGRVVEPRNPEQLGAAIVELMADMGALADLGALARRQAENLFGQEQERLAHLAAYMRLTGRTSPSGDDPVDITAEEPAEPVPAPVQRGEEPLEPLLAELRVRVPIPVHRLEVAAVLESCGVNDESARRHGARDVFELGERLLRVLQASGPRVPLAPHQTAVPAAPGHLGYGWARWALMAMPSVAVLATVQIVRGRSGSTGGSTALMVGLLVGFFTSNVLLQGLTPRASLYVGCQNWAFARQLVRRFTRLTVPLLASMAVGGLLVSDLTGLGTGPQRLIAAAGLMAAGVFWVASAGLVVAQALHEVGALALAGIVVTLGVDRSLADVTSRADLIGVLVGYLVAVVGVTVRSRQRLAGTGGPHATAGLPPIGRMARESVPYMLYAGFVLGLLFVPHLTVWLHPGLHLGRARVTALEFAMNLPLLPVLTAAILIERTANLYWAHARDSQIRTPAHRTVDFAESLAGFYSRRRRLQCCYLAVSGLALYVGVESALWLGWLKSLIPASEVTEVRQALLLSLGGCLVLAVALFDASAAISLGSLSAVVSSFATAGLVSLLTVAVVTTWFPPSAAPLTLCVGSCISAALCRRQLRVALQRAAHRYFAIL